MKAWVLAALIVEGLVCIAFFIYFALSTGLLEVKLYSGAILPRVYPEFFKTNHLAVFLTWTASLLALVPAIAVGVLYIWNRRPEPAAPGAQALFVPFVLLAIALPVAFKLYAKGSAIEKRQDAINLAEARRRVASGKLSICDFIKIGHYTDEEFAQCEAVKSRQTNTDNR